MDYKKIIQQFADRAQAIVGKLTLAQKSDVAREDVLKLVYDMEKSLESSTVEMFYAAVYNARATIMTAPENCSVSQLKEALCDGAEGLRLMCEYFEA